MGDTRERPTSSSAVTAPTQAELDALIEEARQRARRRRQGYAAVLVVVALIGLGAYLFVGGGGGPGDGSGGSPGSPPGGVAGAGQHETQTAKVRHPRAKCPGSKYFHRFRPVPATLDPSPNQTHYPPLDEAGSEWSVTSPKARTTVMVGGIDAEGTTGVVEITRSLSCSQDSDAWSYRFFEVGGSGRLGITGYPEDAAGDGPAGQRGALEIQNEAGDSIGELDLTDGNLHLNPDNPDLAVISAHPCPGIEAAPGVVGAGGADVYGMDCEEAAEFLRTSGQACQPFSGLKDGKTCIAGDYRCVENGDLGSGTVPAVCQSGPRRLEIGWSTG